MKRQTEPKQEYRTLAERSLPTLLLLGVYALAGLPLLQGVPITESAGPAWALLWTLPAGVVATLIAWRRGWPRVLGILAGLALWAGFFSLWGAGNLDPFEARRSAMVFCTSAVALGCGAVLSRSGRREFLSGLAWLPWVLVLAILWHQVRVPQDWMQAISQPAGNRSDLAEFAWPGLVAGCGFFLVTRNRTRAIAALLGALSVALLVGAGPLYAGIFALLGATAITWVLGWRQAYSRRLGRVLLVASAVCALSLGLRQALESDSPAPGAQVAGETSLGTSADPTAEDSAVAADRNSPLAQDRQQGLWVRWNIWKGTWAMLAQHPWSGVGPGQFQQAFPPYRLAQEIERSSHAGQVQNAVEVEHAHNDLLNVLSQWGWPLGALWLLVLAVITWRACQALTAQDKSKTGPAVIWIGTLLWGVWNTPLTAPVFSHVLSWICAGMLLAPQRWPSTRSWMRLSVPAVLCLLALLQSWPAWQTARHGAWLAQASQDSVATDATGAKGQGVQYLEPALLERARKGMPDSPFALDLLAHHPKVPLDQQLKHLDRLVKLRPHHRGYWNDRGTRLARQSVEDFMPGDPDPVERMREALASFQKALAIDPNFPPALRNQISASEDLADHGELQNAIREARSRGALDDASLLPRAHTLLLQGYPELAAVYGQLHNPELNFGDAQVCYQQAQAARAAGEALPGRAYRVGYQQLFGREHGAKRDWKSAVLSYRQACRDARDSKNDNHVPLALLLELAAAKSLEGDVEGALADLPGQSWSSLPPRARLHLPDWARQALIRLLPHERDEE